VPAGGGRRAPALILVLAGTCLLAGCARGAGPVATPPQPPADAEAEAAVAVVVAGAGTAPVAGAPVSYTEAQAERGRDVFDAVCSACHALGEFRGQMFQVTWMARPIGHFFQHISQAMPEDRPGSLTPAQYASVVAYVLQLQGHPPGGRELPADASALEAVAWPR